MNESDGYDNRRMRLVVWHAMKLGLKFARERAAPFNNLDDALDVFGADLVPELDAMIDSMTPRPSALLETSLYKSCLSGFLAAVAERGFKS
mgnify:CR=1 FL=1